LECSGQRTKVLRSSPFLPLSWHRQHWVGIIVSGDIDLSSGCLSHPLHFPPCGSFFAAAFRRCTRITKAGFRRQSSPITCQSFRRSRRLHPAISPTLTTGSFSGLLHSAFWPSPPVAGFQKRPAESFLHSHAWVAFTLLPFWFRRF